MLEQQDKVIPNQRNLSVLFQTAIKNSLVADALSMPVHWYYRTSDILLAFPDGIKQLYAAPDSHPSSIMSLHSKQQGGRQSSYLASSQVTEVVGEVILKGKEEFWNQSNIHYHQGMQAGENTLNAHTVLWLFQSIQASGNHYNEDDFLALYISNMTSELPMHPDTYAESYHRGFFANWIKGRQPNQCAAVTHDTPSVGGLVRIGPLVLHMLHAGFSLVECKSEAAVHLKLTHPDAQLTRVCFQYIDLIFELVNTADIDERCLLVQHYLKQVAGRYFKRKSISDFQDNQIVGGVFSTACYITDSWPSVLYLAAKYPNDTFKALQVNAELGGDNVHRGSVLAVLLSLVNHQSLDETYAKLIVSEPVDDLLNKVFH